jgi:hypothetical protein
LDQLPLLTQVDNPVAALSGLVQEMPEQSVLSLEDAVQEASQSFPAISSDPQESLALELASPPAVPDTSTPQPSHGEENKP